MKLQLNIFAVSALVPASMLIAPAHSIERVTEESPNQAAPSVNIKQVPINCVETLSANAGITCPQPCMVPVADATLPQSDSCDPQNWSCVWPAQPVGEVVDCPAGWNGKVTQDRIFEVQNCGTNLRDTGEVTVLSADCTRVRTETKVEPCPQPLGGGFTGAGVTYSRQVDEKLHLDLQTIDSTFSDWTLDSVDCKRTVTQIDYSFCDGGGCFMRLVGEDIIQNDNCPEVNVSTNTQGQTSVTMETPHTGARTEIPEILNNDLTTVSLETPVAQLPRTVASSCPTGSDGEGSAGSDGPAGNGSDGGEGEGDGEGDGEPLTIDLDDDGIEIIPLAQSSAHLDYKLRGYGHRTAWIGPREGILARDLNNNKVIDGIREVFSDREHPTGFEELATLDANKDQVIDAKDPEFRNLRVWRDRTGDAIGQRDELTTLTKEGVKSISLKHRSVNYVMKDARIPVISDVTLKDGTLRNIVVLFLKFDKDSAINIEQPSGESSPSSKDETKAKAPKKEDPKSPPKK